MKSLPSYDEALKRASETQGSKKIPVQQSTYSKSHAPVSKSIDINSIYLKMIPLFITEFNNHYNNF